jgi:hypothetical protein
MKIIDHKDIKLSSKVIEILSKRGYSHIFNWNEYNEYKKSTSGKIFQAYAIADLFVLNSCEFSDFEEYVF